MMSLAILTDGRHQPHASAGKYLDQYLPLKVDPLRLIGRRFSD